MADILALAVLRIADMYRYIGFDRKIALLRPKCSSRDFFAHFKHALESNFAFFHPSLRKSTPPFRKISPCEPKFHGSCFEIGQTRTIS